MGIFRPTTAEIHLSALKYNFQKLKDLLPPTVRIMAMVKADAYGHGAVEVSRTLSELGTAALGVATVEEGLELREAHILTPILVLGGLMGVGSAAAGMIVGADLTPVVHSAEVLDFLEATSASAGRTTGVHLKIDTGMTRLGVMPSSMFHVLNKLKECGHLRLDGVMTHFAEALDHEYTAHQIESFKECVHQVEKILGTVPVWHVANSAAVVENEYLTNATACEHWVRTGAAVYGAGSEQVVAKLRTKPVMTLKSKIAMIKSVPAGTKVSYGCTFETPRQSKIGIVPIGYADGYPFALSNKAQVLVRGRRVPVVGRVTMDMTMIDLTDLGEPHVGDEVVLMGEQGGANISCEEIAGLAGTIPYEILCGVSKRMPRVYVR